MRRQVEYGGYLSIDIDDKGAGYWDEYKPIKFHCARHAILYIVQKMEYEHVYLPYYLCDTVDNTLRDNSIKTTYYHIDKLMQPQLEDVDSNSVVIITNYFGNHHNGQEYVGKYENVIFDNTQAFFEKPINGAFNVYSCRKFFGVTDGAYLISDLDIPSGIDCVERFVPRSAGYLTEAIALGTNEAYGKSLDNEEQLCEKGLYRMSELSERLLKAIDYEFVKTRRKNNYYTLAEQLGGNNYIDDSIDEESYAMIYPFVIERTNARHLLVDESIYVPQWWKVVLEQGEGNEYENYLSEYLLPLPIDQRYSEMDMLEVARKVKDVCC